MCAVINNKPKGIIWTQTEHLDISGHAEYAVKFHLIINAKTTENCKLTIKSLIKSSISHTLEAINQQSALKDVNMRIQKS